MKKIMLGCLLALLALAGGVDAQVHTNANSLGGRALAQRIPTWVLLCRTFASTSAPADTNEDTVGTCTVPANAMGANGAVRVTIFTSYTNNANAKTTKVYWGGLAGTIIGSFSEASVAQRGATFLIVNKQATNSQLAMFMGGSSASANTFRNTSAQDSTAAITVTVTVQKTTAGDTMSLDALIVEGLSDGT